MNLTRCGRPWGTHVAIVTSSETIYLAYFVNTLNNRLREKPFVV